MSASGLIIAFKANPTANMMSYISQNIELFYLEEEFYTIDYKTIVKIMKKTKELKPGIVTTIIKGISRYHTFDPLEFLTHCNTDKTTVYQRLAIIDPSSGITKPGNDAILEHTKRIVTLEQALKDQDNKIELLTDRIMKLEVTVNMQNNTFLQSDANNSLFASENEETNVLANSKSLFSDITDHKPQLEKFNVSLQNQESLINSVNSKMNKESNSIVEKLQQDNINFKDRIDKLERELRDSRNQELINEVRMEYLDFKKDIMKQMSMNSKTMYDDSGFPITSLDFLEYCGKGDLRSVTQLLNNNSSMVNIRSDSNGWRPLHVAVYYNHKEVVETLIRYGANINEVDNFGRTPLFLAAQHNRLEIAELLINHGADIHIRTRKIFYFFMVKLPCKAL